MPLAFIARRKWKTAASCLATSSLLMLLSFAAVGMSGFRQWLQLVQAPSSDITPYVMGNIRALNIHFGAVIGTIAFGLTLLCFLIVLRQGTFHETFAAAVITTLLISPHTYWQDYSLMALIVMLMTNSAARLLLLLPWPYFYSRADELPMIFLALIYLMGMAAKPLILRLPIFKGRSGAAAIERT